MKNTMPRLIDDKRRMTTGLICLGMAALAGAALCGWYAWMAPYWAIHAELKELVREGKTFLARFDESFAMGDEGELEKALKKAQTMSSVNLEEVPRMASFELDTELYVAADRPKAERLLVGYAEAAAEYERHKKALGASVVSASEVADSIQSFWESPAGKHAQDARSDLEQSLLELEGLIALPRPDARVSADAKKRFAVAQEKASATRAQAAEWCMAVHRELERVAGLAARMSSAEEGMNAAATRASGIRQEALALEIDQHSGRLAILRENLQSAAKDAKEAATAYAAAKKAADERWSAIQRKAREECKAILASIDRLDAEHGKALPEEVVKKGREACASLEKSVKELNDSWDAQGAKAAALAVRENSLQSEASRIVEQIEIARRTGSAVLDGTRAAALPDELAAIRRDFAVAATALKTDAAQRQMESIAALAQTALTTLRSWVPDAARQSEEIRQAAKAVRDELERAKGDKAELEEIISGGRGDNKAKLEQMLKALAFPDDAEHELIRLESASATNGRDCLKLRERLEKAKSGAEEFGSKMRIVRRFMEQSISTEQFALASWEAGAIGWPVEKPTMTRISGGSVLVPNAAVSGRAYEWEFDLEFAKPGTHSLEVLVSKPLADPVNPSIDRNQSVVQEGQRLKGGFINVAGQLTLAGHTWRDNLWIHNYPKLVSPQRVVGGSGWLGEGYQTFHLRIDLDSNPRDFRDGGVWKPGLLQFTVMLDGKPVRQFWHRVR